MSLANPNHCAAVAFNLASLVLGGVVGYQAFGAVGAVGGVFAGGFVGHTGANLAFG